MSENSTNTVPNVVHYTYWGGPPQLCALTPGVRTHLGTLSARHEYITCPDCKAHQTYRDHVFLREIAFNGNFNDFDTSLKNKYFAGEPTG